MKIWPALLLLLPLSGLAQSDAENRPPAGGDGSVADEAAAGPYDPNNPPINWVDTSHAAITNQAQELTQWMDDFFGDRTYNLEQAESWLRLEFIEKWDEGEGTDFKVRLRGKVQLPRISKRLDLVFQEDDDEGLTEEERNEQDHIGLQYKVSEGRRSRFDATLGFSSSGPKPGVRYRLEDALSESTTYRFVQRVQWESDDGFYATSRFDINRILSDNKILRWANRAVYGQETEGVEWRTGLALRQRKKVETKRPIAISYFGSINGETDPRSYVKNYRIGVLWRRKIYRDYLYVEMEPSYNYGKSTPEDKRQFAWSAVLRLEVALERDLRRVKD